MSTPTATAIDYRELADAVVNTAKDVQRDIELAKDVLRRQEEKKQQELKAKYGEEYDKDIEREMIPKKWTDLATTGVNSLHLDRDGWGRCSYLKDSLYKFNARYPGFKFNCTNHSKDPSNPLDQSNFSRCGLRITAMPKTKTQIKPSEPGFFPLPTADS